MYTATTSITTAATSYATIILAMTTIAETKGRKLKLSRKFLGGS